MIMSDRSKYSLTGVYRWENFAQHVQRNNFPKVQIGSASGINEWWITFQISNQNNSPVVYPFIYCYHKPTLLLRRFFRVIKKNESSCFQRQGCFLTFAHRGPSGVFMNVAELLNEENGYLDDDGALTIECGLHVDGILEDDNIWKFNLKDNFFGYEKNEKNMIICTEIQTKREHVLHVHPQLLTFESFPSLDFWSRPDGIEICLQIAHGVRFHLDSLPPCDWNIIFLKTIKVAQSLKLPNVAAYCERELMKQDIYKLPVWMFFRVSIKLGFRRILAFFLREITEKWVLINAVKEVETDQMTGETMKMLAGKIFELGTENY